MIGCFVDRLLDLSCCCGIQTFSLHDSIAHVPWMLQSKPCKCVAWWHKNLFPLCVRTPLMLLPAFLIQWFYNSQQFPINKFNLNGKRIIIVQWHLLGAPGFQHQNLLSPCHLNVCLKPLISLIITCHNLLPLGVHVYTVINQQKRNASPKLTCNECFGWRRDFWRLHMCGSVQGYLRELFLSFLWLATCIRFNQGRCFTEDAAMTAGIIPLVLLI